MSSHFRLRTLPHTAAPLSARQSAKKRRALSAEERRTVRQQRSRPIIDDIEPWLRAKLALISQKTKLAQAIRYALSRWNGLTRFLDDGRIEIDSNVRKNALFAGSDEGASYCSCRHPFIKAAYFVGDYQAAGVLIGARRLHYGRIRAPSRLAG